MKPIKMKLARIKTIRLTFWWKEKWKQSHGIMLITTLLILALLVGMTVGFITINRDNLLLATNAKAQEAALQAAYAGLQYVQMRFEEDEAYGPDLCKTGKNCAQANTWESPVSSPPDFASFEGNQTAVGILNNGKSAFEVIFGNTEYLFDGSHGIVSNPNNPSAWTNTSAIPPNSPEVSINNLDSSTGGVPNETARIIVLGYSDGAIRHVEAMFQLKGYINSSAESANNISVNLGCSSPQGNNMWQITSSDPLNNNIIAGASWNGSTFQPTGGNISGPAGASGSGLPNQVTFSSSPGTGEAGAAYALSGGKTGEGEITVGSTVGQSSGTVRTADGTGYFQAGASSNGNLPSKLLSASDILNQIGAGSTAMTSGSSSVDVPTTNAYPIPAGIWAFESDGGKGDIVDVYDPTTGNLIDRFQGNVCASGSKSCGPASSIFSINNYQIQVQPGMNLVVDSGYSNQCNPCSSLPAPSPALSSNTISNPSGNFMLTLSPVDFTAANENQDASSGGPNSGKQVLPSLALAYTGTNQVGNNNASITLGGNLYVQGQLEGYGAVVAQSGAAAPSTWVTSTGTSSSSTYLNPYWGNSWANSILSATASGTSQLAPASGDSGDVYVEGNSELSAAPSKSMAIYANGNAAFNPIPPYTANQTNTAWDQALSQAMNGYAGNSASSPIAQTSNAPCGGSGPNCYAGWNYNDSSSNQINFEGLGGSTYSCGSFTCYQDQYQTSGLDNGSLDSQSFSTSTTSVFHDNSRILRRSCYNCSNPTSNSSGITGLENAPVSASYLGIFPENTSTGTLKDTTLSSFLVSMGVTPSCTTSGCSLSGSLSLYQFTQVEEYESAGGSGGGAAASAWLNYQQPPWDCSCNLDPVEQTILDQINTQYTAAQGQTPHQQLGYYVYQVSTSSSTLQQYQPQDMTFKGLIYVNGPKGFQANPNCYQFTVQGSLVTTGANDDTGNANISINNAGQVNFIYDPSQVLGYTQNLKNGARTQILWMTVW